MRLADALTVGEVVVLKDDDRELLVLWNGSATFNIVAFDGDAVECFTHYTTKEMEIKDAIVIARRWYKEWIEDD